MICDRFNYRYFLRYTDASRHATRVTPVAVRSTWRTNQKRVYKDSASEILYRSVRTGTNLRYVSDLLFGANSRPCARNKSFYCRYEKNMASLSYGAAPILTRTFLTPCRVRTLYSGNHTQRPTRRLCRNAAEKAAHKPIIVNTLTNVRWHYRAHSLSTSSFKF